MIASSETLLCRSVTDRVPSDPKLVLLVEELVLTVEKVVPREQVAVRREQVAVRREQVAAPRDDGIGEHEPIAFEPDRFRVSRGPCIMS